MTVGDLNPFRPTRWEHQRTGHHLIWFAHTAEQLTDDKSVYVRGSRGSGKTTLLKSICWEDLTHNPSLKLQRKLTDFSYIGVYVRFPDHISASLSYSAWDRIYPLSPNPDLEMHRFFSLAVELVCLDRCLSACHELRVDGACKLLPSEESRIVHAILDEFPALKEMSEVQYTFHSLARICRMTVREMNQACARGTVADVNERLPVREPGELLKFATNQLAQSLELVGDDERENEIGFKFCLDDCEVLNPRQQRSLNTLVRTSEHPVSWVISCVGSFFDTTDTFIDQQPLTDHDRRIVMLDARNAAEFRSLCQAVLSLRLYFSVSDETRENYKGLINEFFQLEARLGRRDVNDLFDAIIRASKSPYARNLRDTADALRIALRRQNRRFRAKYPPKSTDYPYYEAYILLLWNDSADAFRTDFGPADQARVTQQSELFETPAFEAWLRRKQAAALLHFAAKLGFRRIPFAGTPMIAHLADGSVRDFLEIVGEIFDAYCKRHSIERNSLDALDRFATSRTLVGWPIQVNGVYNASTSYLSGISNRSELDASVITRFVDGLGQYTSELQSNPNDPSVLGRAERGIFTVRFKQWGPEAPDPEKQAIDDSVWNVIRQAELAGYIRTTDIRFGAGVAKKLAEQDARVISFRLHHRFAPHFRFSYRGAYEPVAITVDDLAVLLDRINQVDSKQWAARMASRRFDDVSQLRLKLTRATDDE